MVLGAGDGVLGGREPVCVENHPCVDPLGGQVIAEPREAANERRVFAAAELSAHRFGEHDGRYMRYDRSGRDLTHHARSPNVPRRSATFFTLAKKSKLQVPPSRPMPDQPSPPNGASRSRTKKQLTHTVPA